MADVQISNTPGTDSGSSAGWVWAIVVIALLAIIAWFLFFRGPSGDSTDIDINVPGGGTPPPAAGTPPPPPPTS